MWKATTTAYVEDPVNSDYGRALHLFHGKTMNLKLTLPNWMVREDPDGDSRITVVGLPP